MSFYNALMGENGLADVLLAIIKLPKDQIPRYRDCYLSEDGKHVVVYTRTGGGNREGFMEENATLAKHALFSGDYDDDFDCTFAYWNFSIPEEFKQDCLELADKGKGSKPAGERFGDLIDRLKAGDKDDPQVAKALEVGAKIMGKLQEGFDSGKPTIVEV